MPAPINPLRHARAWKPSADQELLLRAALLKGADALSAWDAWSGAVDWNALDGASERLLPLLYLNLRQLNVRHPAMEQLRRAYQISSERNRRWRARVTEALALVAQAGIPTLMLKAGTLIPLYYQDLGARPTKDIDVLVPTEAAWEALQVLGGAGWVPERRPLAAFDRTYLERNYAHTLIFADGFQLDLHRHVISTETRQDGDKDFWAAAEPIDFFDVKTLAMGTADLMLHTLIHGTPWNALPPIRWVADAWMILRRGTLDWDRLVAQAVRRELILSTRNGLHYMRETLGAEIPPAVLQALDASEVTRAEQIKYELMVNPPTAHGTGDKLWYHYDQYRRLSAVYGRQGRFRGFPEYLRDTWGLRRTRDVPVYMARFVLRRMGELSRR